MSTQHPARLSTDETGPAPEPSPEQAERAAKIAAQLDGLKAERDALRTAEDTRTPAERRGYPLPPWAALEFARYPTGEEVLAWLLDLSLDGIGTDPVGHPQAVAYLDAITTARADAQAAASRCAIEDHAGALGDVDTLTRRLAALRERYRALEELYAATPPVRVVTDLTTDLDLDVDVLTVRLAFAQGTHVLDEEARGRIAEAAGVAVFTAYEREHTAATIVDVTTLADTAPRYEVLGDEGGLGGISRGVAD